MPIFESMNMITMNNLDPPFLKTFFKKKINSNYCIPTKVIKVGLSPSKIIAFICFTESPLEMTKYASYFLLKALFVLAIFTFLFRIFGYVEKRARSRFMTSLMGNKQLQ